MKTRAAVLENSASRWKCRSSTSRSLKTAKSLVRLVACGVCHTDLFTASGADPSGYKPAVLGHEGAGVVERSARA